MLGDSLVEHLHGFYGLAPLIDQGNHLLAGGTVSIQAGQCIDHRLFGLFRAGAVTQHTDFALRIAQLAECLL